MTSHVFNIDVKNKIKSKFKKMEKIAFFRDIAALCLHAYREWDVRVT